MKIYKQVGGLPFFYLNDTCHIVLVTSKRLKKWIIPKGIIESGDTEVDTVLQEAYEEGGIVGRVSDRVLGFYEYEKWGGIVRVKVYPLVVDELMDKWPEDSFRKRKTLSLEQACDNVYFQELKTIIKKFDAKRTWQEMA